MQPKYYQRSERMSDIEFIKKVLKLTCAARNLVDYTQKWIRKLLTYFGQTYFDTLETAIDEYEEYEQK
jgi:hypothetical protein